MGSGANFRHIPEVRSLHPVWVLSKRCRVCLAKLADCQQGLEWVNGRCDPVFSRNHNLDAAQIGGRRMSRSHHAAIGLPGIKAFAQMKSF